MINNLRLNFIHMKNFFIAISFLLLFSFNVMGQQVKHKDIELDDIMTLLNISGYELFNFDISDMSGKGYDLVFTTKEYAAGEEVSSTNFRTGRVRAENYVEKISLAFLPPANDSTRVMRINLPDFASFAAPTFKLKGLSMKGFDRKIYRYKIRPFKLGEIKNSEFIPLILFASGWYDDVSNVLRFCVEKAFDPDMSSPSLKKIPHYYVVGINFNLLEP